MAQNFLSCDREQVLLLPPSLSDWLPEDHLVWTVLGARIGALVGAVVPLALAGFLFGFVMGIRVVVKRFDDV